MAVKFYKSENQVPLEMHKVRMIQKLSLLPVEDRLKKIQEAGNNTFLLQNKDIYMDMLTDSGVNGMSDLQFGAMMQADDAYAGSETFNRVKAAVKEVLVQKTSCRHTREEHVRISLPRLLSSRVWWHL